VSKSHHAILLLVLVVSSGLLYWAARLAPMALSIIEMAVLALVLLIWAKSMAERETPGRSYDLIALLALLGAFSFLCWIVRLERLALALIVVGGVAPFLLVWVKRRRDWKIMVSPFTNGSGHELPDIDKSMQSALVFELRRRIREKRYPAKIGGEPKENPIPVPEAYAPFLIHAFPDCGIEIRGTLYLIDQMGKTPMVMVEIVDLPSGNPLQEMSIKGDCLPAVPYHALYHALVPEIADGIYWSGLWIDSQMWGTRSLQAYTLAMDGWEDQEKAYDARKHWRLRESEQSFASAAESYEQALQHDSKLSWVYINLADMYVRLSKWEDATSGYQRCLKLRKHLGYSYSGLGHVRLQQKKYEDAALNYTCSLVHLTQDEDYYEVLLKRAVALLLQSRSQPSSSETTKGQVQDLLSVVRELPRKKGTKFTAGISYALAGCYQVKGDTKLALKYIEDAMKEEPTRLLDVIDDPEWESLRKTRDWRDLLSGLLGETEGRLKLPLNKCNRNELESLNHIGDKRAKRILELRNERKFECIDELTSRCVLHVGRLAKIKHLIAV